MVNKSAAKFNLCSLSINPGAKIMTKIGAAITPMAVITNNIAANVPLVLAISSLRSLSPRWRYSAKTGIKACAKAPSANKRRKKFGILKATKNTSAPMPAPNNRAITISRTNPSIRDKNVIMLTTIVDLNNFSLIRVVTINDRI